MCVRFFFCLKVVCKKKISLLYLLRSLPPLPPFPFPLPNPWPIQLSPSVTRAISLLRTPLHPAMLGLGSLSHSVTTLFTLPHSSPPFTLPLPCHGSSFSSLLSPPFHPFPLPYPRPPYRSLFLSPFAYLIMGPFCAVPSCRTLRYLHHSIIDMVTVMEEGPEPRPLGGVAPPS